jgi:hypothetical protein
LKAERFAAARIVSPARVDRVFPDVQLAFIPGR